VNKEINYEKLEEELKLELKEKIAIEDGEEIEMEFLKADEEDKLINDIDLEKR